MCGKRIGPAGKMIRKLQRKDLDHVFRLGVCVCVYVCRMNRNKKARYTISGKGRGEEEIER